MYANKLLQNQFIIKEKEFSKLMRLNLTLNDTKPFTYKIIHKYVNFLKEIYTA